MNTTTLVRNTPVVALKVALVLALGFTAASAAPAQILFTDVTASAGVSFHQESETVVPIGGGAAWVDLDADGNDDLYSAVADGCNKLYRNMGDGTFNESPNAAGSADCDATSHGVAVADYDNDGDQDIYVTNFGQNRLFQNQWSQTGAVAFVDVTFAAGMDGDGAANSASAAWGDYDSDGFLDLVVVNHAMYMPWDIDACRADLVWHNNGDGSFTEVAGDLGVALSGMTGVPGCGLAVTWSDYDDDGDTDLFIVNDFGEVNVPNRLFRNDGTDGVGGWVFSEMSRPAVIDFAMFGMGIAVSDWDRDGDFDYYMSDAGPNNLAINIGNGTFSEIGAVSGVLASAPETYGGMGLVSWGNVFFDVNGDGFEDLFVANGGAPEDKWPGIFGDDYQDLSPVFAYLNQRNRTFVEGHAMIGLTADGYGRTVLTSDYDDDGDMDLFVGVLQDNATLYRNDSGVSFNWLKVKPVGTVSNLDAIGAKVEIRNGTTRQIREVSGGSGFLSRNSLTVHFGVGNANVVDQVKVRFPSGIVVSLSDVLVNQTLEVVETAP